MTGMTNAVSELVQKLGAFSQITLILLFSFIYLILGCFLDSISMLCITIPVFNPIINAAGIDPIWYATIVIVSVEIGLITPARGAESLRGQRSCRVGCEPGRHHQRHHALFNCGRNYNFFSFYIILFFNYFHYSFIS